MRTTPEQLFQALARVGLNQSAAARALGVTRETVRQWLRPMGGLVGILALAAKRAWASRDVLDDLAPLAVGTAKGAKGAKTANHMDTANTANATGNWHLRADEENPTVSSPMSTATLAVPQSSQVRLDGARREFAKRVALEVELKVGLPREDMSSVVGRMVDWFRDRGDPAAVAQMLIKGKGEKTVPAKKARKRDDEGGRG